MRGGIALLLGALCVGCAGRAVRGPVYAGDVDGRAALEALPSADVANTQLSEDMRMARLLSAECIALVPPVPPVGRSAAELTAWSEQAYKPWLQRKQRAAEAARAQIDKAALHSQRERIMAGALLGLVFEDVARGLLVVPAPSELNDEPEIAAMFQETLLDQAEPYLQHARLAYAACAGNALGQARLAHWSGFCEGRAASLPGAQQEPEQDGVTVIRTAGF